MSHQIVRQVPDPDISELMRLGQVLAQSGMFQDARGEAQAVVKVLAGRELGFGPIAAMTGVHVIKGRVTLSANLMAAAIKRSGRYNYRVNWLEEDGCEIVFFEDGQECGSSVFTLQDARRAGLNGDNWQKYPRNMTFARALSNGAKWYCPDIFGGPVYTPDELGALVDGETGAVVEAPAPASANGTRHTEPSPPTHPSLDDVFTVAASLGFNELTARRILKAAGFRGFKPERFEAMTQTLQAEYAALETQAANTEQ